MMGNLQHIGCDERPPLTMTCSIVLSMSPENKNRVLL